MAKSCLGLLQLLCLSRAFYQTDSTLCVLNSTDAQSSHQYLTSQCESYVNFSRESLSADSDHEISIHLCSSVFEIEEQDVVTFRDMVNVSIIGVEGRSTLHCQNGTTGLQFINVNTVEIENVILDQCSFSNTNDHFEVNFSSSIYISGCTTVSITNVTVQNTVGVGLALIENKYIFSITNSTFMNNRPGNTSAGGGVFIKSSTIENGSFIIKNCTFTNNSAKNDSNKFGKSNSDDVIDFVRGGGMNVYFRGETHHVNLTIFNCTFNNNCARYGGALQLSFIGSSHDINILVNQSDFRHNRAQKRGGAVGAGFIQELLEKKQNLIEFSNCNFSNNRAWQGGGVYLYATPTNYTNCNQFEFYKCLWNNNTATYGAAIKMNPYTIYRGLIRDKHFPKALFRDCMFIANDAVHHNHSINTTISNTTYQIRNHGKGIVLAHKLQTILQGMTCFEKNIGSAVYLLSSILEIEQGSNIKFINNHGYEGGAIGLQGSSVIYINDNIYISFLNNSASVKGGAISQETLHTPSDMTASKCFIKYAGDYSKNITERNITLFFYNNTIHPYNVKLNSSEIHKQSIFVFSDLPCMKINKQAKNYLEALNSIAQFNFNCSYDIAAISSKFEVNDIPEKLIPGKETYMNITLRDGLNNNDSSPVYRVSITKIYNGKVFIDSIHKYIINNTLTVLGEPRSQAKIRITLSNLQDTELSFNITLQACHPGYIFDEKKYECVCSARTDYKYQGIRYCKNSQAVLLLGYWAGYNTSNESEITSNHFRTAQCPVGFCRKNDKRIFLPEFASINELNKTVCNKKRHGRICANCTNGTSVFYHTQNTFDCIEDKHCSWGIVLYFISEIVPVTILFLLVILFDIKLTSGALNPFIFYTQIFETLTINAIPFDDKASVILEILNFIVSFFNLEFFEHSRLSFCLFKGATSLNIIAFNYVTVIYSLLLVLLTVALMNTRLNKYIQKIKGRKTYISQSIIHGLSGFLVLCYARSTKISLHILNPIQLFAVNSAKKEKVVAYYGEFDYFEPNHLPYAIPAIFALIVMSLLPPLLLLSYPLCYKVLAVFRIQESKFTRILCKIFPLEKFKPFFDSFQGSFKDEYRYFSGLYFLYRLSALLIYTFNDYPAMFYFLLELQFILTLIIHSWIQPYKKKWHNRLDIFLFTLLAILNGITVWNYHLRLSLQDINHYIKFWYGIQLFLAYIPLLFTAGYILIKIIKKVATRWHLRVRFRRSERNSEPSFILERETSLMMPERDKQKELDNLNYQKCQ